MRRVATLPALGVVALLAWPSAAMAAAPADTSPPSAPTAYEFGHKQTSVELGWSVPSDSFDVETFVISNGSRTWESPAWDQWWRDLTGLATNRTYSFTVRARDAAGNVSPPSNVVSVFIETQPPTAPPNLRVAGDRLVWDAATDNSGSVSMYIVFVDGTMLSQTIGTDASLRGFDPLTYETIPPPGTHVYTVKAKDPSSNLSTNSNPVTVQIR